MKSWIFSFVCVATLLVAIPLSKAETYSPGTIGYLYEDCQKAVQSETIEDFEKSWCGTFIQGYMDGAFAAMMKNHHNKDYPKTIAQCDEATRKERENIRNSNTCPHLHYLLTEAENPLNIARGLPIWVSWEKQHDTNILNQYASPHINRIIKSKNFCKYVIENKFDTKPFAANPYLVKISSKEWEAASKKIRENARQNYKICIKEYANSGNSEKFAASLCGASNIGLLSGVYYTDTLPVEQVDQVCATDIEIIRKHEITVQELCLPNDLSPEDILKAANTPEWKDFCKEAQ